MNVKKLAEQAGVTFDSLGASYTYGSLPDFLERFAELVRQDEREAMGVKVRAAEFISAASKAPDAIGRPIMWAEFPTRGNT